MKPSSILPKILFGSALFITASTTHAATRTWTGGTSGSWNTAGNWSASGVPATADLIQFDGTGANLNTTTNNAFSLTSLTFTAGQSAAVTINTTTGTSLTLTGSNAITVNTGNHSLRGNGTSGSGTAYDLAMTNANTTLAINGTSSFDVNGRVRSPTSSSQLFTKTGTGTLIFSSNNGSSGAWQFDTFTVSAGVVRFAENNATGNSRNNYSVTSGAAFELSGGASLNLAGTNTSEGNVTLNGTGIGGNGAMRSISGNNRISPSAGASGLIRLNTNSSIGVDADTLTIGKGISGTGSLTKVGAGTLVLGRASGINNNTYSGATLVDAGTLHFAITGALYNGTSASWTAANINAKSGATLAFNVGGTSEFTTGEVTTLLTNLAASSSTSNGMNAGSTLGFDTTNASGGSFTIADSITDTTGASGGARGLTKLGTGTLVLTGTNTYSGATTVTSGALAVNNSLSSTASVTVNTGATIQGSGSINSSVTIEGGGTLAPGNSIESIGAGNLSLLAGATYAFEMQTNLYAGTPNESADLTYSSGTLDIAPGAILTLTDLAASTALANGSKLTLISYFGGWATDELFSYDAGSGLTTLADDSTFTLGANSWRFDYNDTIGGLNYSGDQSGATSFVTMTVIPEPSTILLSGLAVLGLCLHRRR